MQSNQRDLPAAAFQLPPLWAWPHRQIQFNESGRENCVEKFKMLFVRLKSKANGGGKERLPLVRYRFTHSIAVGEWELEKQNRNFSNPEGASNCTNQASKNFPMTIAYSEHSSPENSRQRRRRRLDSAAKKRRKISEVDSEQNSNPFSLLLSSSCKLFNTLFILSRVLGAREGNER